jgi:hypothetical protein
MKTILKSTMLLMLSVGLFAACADDNDSNPVIGSPSTFNLNTPSYAAIPVDLATSTELPFTWSEPDYGFPVAADYQLEASIDGNFTIPVDEAALDESGSTIPNYVTLPASFQGGYGTIAASALAAAVNQMGNYGENVPATQALTIRASATAGGRTIYSNTVNILVVPTAEVAPAFPEFIYEIGNESGWSTPHALKSSDAYDGKYQGFYYLDGEFKFKPNKDDWNGDWENDGEGKIADNGGSNMPGVSAGFYRIDVDLAAMTYALKKIEYVSIIGTANGNWDTDTDLTYNKDEGCWEVTCDLNAGEMKFRGNHNWDGDVDLGGSFDNLVHGGSNIAVEAGNYTIKLYISIAGQHKAVVTKN